MASLTDRLASIAQSTPEFDRAAGETCRLLRSAIPHYSWVGVYMIEGGETLVLKAWDGPAATQHVRIPLGQRICGLAAREERTVIVDDVNRDPRYLACFLQTRSEIVVPIFADRRVVGEIDIDSDRPSAFTEADRALLEFAAGELGRVVARGTEP